MRARGALLRALRSMPGHEAFPPTAALVSVVNQRITHWLLPVYGYNAEEELGTLSPEALKGAWGGGGWLRAVERTSCAAKPAHEWRGRISKQALRPADAAALTSCCAAHPIPRAPTEVIERGISAGTLGGPAGSVTVREPFADRSLLLAAMQQRGIKLARYDVVGEEAVPVDRLWPSLILHGGARQVGARWAAGGGEVGSRRQRLAATCHCRCALHALLATCAPSPASRSKLRFPVALSSAGRLRAGHRCHRGRVLGLQQKDVREAASRLAPLEPAADSAAATEQLPAELQQLPAELQQLFSPGLWEVPLPLPLGVEGSLTPPAASAAAGTPFGTFAAAGQLSNLMQVGASELPPGAAAAGLNAE